MPIDNGVGLLAQVLMQQQAGRQRAAAQTAQMQQQQDLTDQGQEFHQQTLAQQLQAQARAQAIHAQMSSQAQAAQDARAEAADTRRAGREDARDQNRMTREDAMKAAQLAFERERLAKEDEWKRLPKDPTVVHNYQHADPNKPPPAAKPDDVRRSPGYARMKSLEGAYREALKGHLANSMLMGPPERAASEKSVSDMYNAWQAELKALGGAGQAPPPEVPPQAGGGFSGF